MFAAASDRAPVLELLAKRGADLKATSKVTDLAALSKDPVALRELTQGNPSPPGEPPAGGRNGPGPAQGAGGRGGRGPQTAGVDRNFNLNELVAAQGGLTPLLLATRDGHTASVTALLNAGADINQVSAGDRTSPLLIATINGHFDLARLLLEKGADPTAASENNATALYAALNVEWAPKSLYPQPRAQVNQKTTYLELMKELLDKGADPNLRLNKKVWYSGYSFDLSGVDETGATPFWRAAYASDVEAMKLLVSYGADPNIRTKRIAGRGRFGDDVREVKDVSGLAPVPVGGTRGHAAPGRSGRRLRRRLRRELASLRADRDAGGGQVPDRGAPRRRQRLRPRRQHRAPSCGRARRRRDDRVPRCPRAPTCTRSHAKGARPRTWPTARCSASSPSRKRSRCSRSSDRKTITSASRADRRCAQHVARRL
jgi:hypothetical protein